MTATPNQKLVHGSLWPEWAPLEAFKVAVFKFARAPSASLVFFRLISLTLLASDLRATFEQGFNPAIDEVKTITTRMNFQHDHGLLGLPKDPTSSPEGRLRERLEAALRAAAEDFQRRAVRELERERKCQDYNVTTTFPAAPDVLSPASEQEVVIWDLADGLGQERGRAFEALMRSKRILSDEYPAFQGWAPSEAGLPLLSLAALGGIVFATKTSPEKCGMSGLQLGLPEQVAEDSEPAHQRRKVSPELYAAPAEVGERFVAPEQVFAPLVDVDTYVASFLRSPLRVDGAPSPQARAQPLKEDEAEAATSAAPTADLADPPPQALGDFLLALPGPFDFRQRYLKQLEQGGIRTPSELKGCFRIDPELLRFLKVGDVDIPYQLFQKVLGASGEGAHAT
ncbi:hypothetical protein JCM8202_003106 [Rhodotorula sphaerocarpa]